ncbi:hypothetical protein [Flavobacterium sp. H122]|uniref:hypothetical protein n=1 Tax=Flavobacterium sp. H122 TaxID=2529860 RepID=UPI00145A05CA|nr:hypothetical protein [Flavobacterium sp. H122]
MKISKAAATVLIIGIIAFYFVYKTMKSTEKKAIIASTHVNISELEPGDQVNKVERRD